MTETVQINSIEEENYKVSKIEEIIEFVFDKISKGIRLIGPFFAFALTVFIAIVTHAFFQVIVPFYNRLIGNFISIFLISIAIFILINLVFNYFMAVLCRPGSFLDTKQSKYYEKNNPLLYDKNIINLEQVFENEANKIKKVEKKSESDETISISPSSNPGNQTENIPEEEPYPNNDYGNLKICRSCNDYKLVRSHHCQICGYCVLKMDHHCPWINNCVGHYNHRYFVLFLTWLLFGCIFVTILSAPLMFKSNIKKSNEFNFVSVLCMVGTLLMVFFNVWNWFLVLRGNTTVEYWMLKSGIKGESTIKDFSLNSWRDNLFLVFGSKSLLKSICCISRKKLPLSGLEWTKLVNSNFVIEKQRFFQLESEENFDEKNIYNEISV